MAEIRGEFYYEKRTKVNDIMKVVILLERQPKGPTLETYIFVELVQSIQISMLQQMFLQIEIFEYKIW